MDLDLVKAVIILGDNHTGKTNLAVHHLRNYSGKREICVVGYPIPIDDFKRISTTKDMWELKHSIIFVDELQRLWPDSDKKTSQEFVQALNYFKHYDNTLVGTTSQSQFLTKTIDNMVDCWNMTRIIDLAGLKNGSRPKRVIRGTIAPQIQHNVLGLANGEYLQYSDCFPPEMNGIFTFKNQGIGKDWLLKGVKP